jgi:cation transport ATPase
MRRRLSPLADIGVAMGARGTAASAEAADMALLVDHFDRIVPAIQIARCSRLIALESVIAGIGLSLLGMIAVALGYITHILALCFRRRSTSRLYSTRCRRWVKARPTVAKQGASIL